MAAGDSIVLIYNLALTAAKDDPCVSPTDPRKGVVLCGIHYDNCRRKLLRREPWKFAKCQVQLAASATPPLLDYGNAYPLPNDFIRFVQEEQPDVWGQKYEIVGQNLLSDDGPPFNLLYIFDCTDPTVFDPIFVDALAKDLAAAIAPSLAQDDNLTQLLKNEAETSFATGATANSQERSSGAFECDVLLASRY